MMGGADPLRVAAVQAESVAGDVERNVAVAVDWIVRAVSEGAALVVLPELFLSGYDPATLRDDAGGCDVTPKDSRLEPLSAAARAGGAGVLVGASVREPEGARSLALLSIARDGHIVTAYRKQHLWNQEREIFAPGGDGASLLLDGWNLGLAICYDGCFPEHARAAADAGAGVYVCPSAYVVGSEHRRDLYYAARALDTGTYVVVAGLVGACGQLEFSGGTAVYDPQGRTLDRVEAGEGLVVVDLDRAVIAEARRINPYEQDRPASLGGRNTLAVE